MKRFIQLRHSLRRRMRLPSSVGRESMTLLSVYPQKGHFMTCSRLSGTVVILMNCPAAGRGTAHVSQNREVLSFCAHYTWRIPGLSRNPCIIFHVFPENIRVRMENPCGLRVIRRYRIDPAKNPPEYTAVPPARCRIAAPNHTNLPPFSAGNPHPSR